MNDYLKKKMNETWNMVSFDPDCEDDRPIFNIGFNAACDLLVPLLREFVSAYNCEFTVNLEKLDESEKITEE